MACNGLPRRSGGHHGVVRLRRASSAALIGVVAGLLVACGDPLERRGQIDDPVGAITVHGACGAWGMLALGLFADGSYGEGWNGVPGAVRGLLFGDPGQLAAQVMGIGTNMVVVFGVSFGFFRAAERLVGNRVSSEVEWNGLDGLEMGSEAYPRE